MLSALDEQLLQLASQRKSPAEIGKFLNVPPEEVLLRINTLLNDRDIYDARQMFLLYLDDLYSLKTMLTREVKENIQNDKAMSNLLRVLDQLARAIEKASEANQDISAKVTKAQTDMMVRMIMAAFDYAVQKNPETIDVLPLVKDALVYTAPALNAV